MAPDGWTEGRTDMDKPISLRLRRGITSYKQRSFDMKCAFGEFNKLDRGPDKGRF